MFEKEKKSESKNDMQIYLTVLRLSRSSMLIVHEMSGQWTSVEITKLHLYGFICINKYKKKDNEVFFGSTHKGFDINKVWKHGIEITTET